MRKIFTLAAVALASTSFASAVETLPASADVMTWYFNAKQFYPSEEIINREIQVAFDGNDVYFTGIDSRFSQWVKGTVNDGVYEFPTQNVGMLWGAYNMNFSGYDGDNAVVATGTMVDGVLTFSTGIGFLYADYPDSGPEVWFESGATFSGEPVEYIEPVLNEHTASLPYKNNFDSESKRDQVGIYSPDEAGWFFGANTETNNWYAFCDNNGGSQANDYLIFPGVTLESGKQYIMSFDANSSAWSDYQYYEVLIAPEAKLSKFTDKLIEYGVCFNTEWENVEKEFSVAETGTYYIAIHCTSYSYSGYFCVDNFVVEAVDMDKPKAVESLNITPGSKGALNANILFWMPTANIGNQTYASDKELNYKLTRGEYIVGEGTAKAGATVQVADDGMGLTNGIATYRVVVSDGTHVSKETQNSAYIGIDYPIETEYIEVSANGNQVTIAWVPVTRGANDGYVGAKYNVYACEGSYQQGTKLNDEPLSDCFYTFEYDLNSGDQRDAWFRVTAVNEIDESYGAYASIFAGAPYELPFMESFADETLYWNYSGDCGSAYVDRWNTWSSDGDGSSLCFYIWNYETQGYYASALTGKIQTAKATLSFDYNADDNASLKVLLCSNSIDEEGAIEVGTYTFEAGTQNTITIPNVFEKVRDRSFVRIAFVVNVETFYKYFFIDNVKIVADPVPAVTMEPEEITAKSFKLTFTPNELTDKYYCCMFDAGTFEEQYNMWSGFMGFSSYGDMVKSWGVALSGTQTQEWKNLTPETAYDIYVLPVDAEGNYGDLQCFPVTTTVQGGEGASVIAIEVGDFGGDSTNGFWQMVTYTPNDQTNVFFDLICTEAFYQENGAEGVKAYLMEEADPANPYYSYYAHTDVDVAQWNAEPGTTYHACAIGKNALGEWGEMTDVVFTTPGDDAIQNINNDKDAAVRYNLQGMKTTEKKGLTIQNGRVMLVK